MLMGGPVGAAVGAALGHQYDDATDGADHDPDSTSAQNGARADPTDATAVGERFFRTTFEVMGHVAKSDGRVSENEIRAARTVMTDFHLNSAQVQGAIACFSRGKASDFDVSDAIMGLRKVCRGRPDLLRIFLEIQVRAAIEGSDLRGAARGVLARVAAMLGVGALEFAHIEAILRLRAGRAGPWSQRTDGHAGNGDWAGHGSREQRQSGGRIAAATLSLAEAYEILEVDAAVSDHEVTKAYRRQLSRHHPDKLKANGLPESMLEHAKQRTQQIIEAWDVIRAHRGLR